MFHVQLSVFPVLLGSSTSFLANISFPYWSEGIKTSPLLLLVLSNFLPKRRKGLHLSAPGVVWSYLGLPISPVGMDAINHLDGHLYAYCVLGGTTKVLEDKVTLGFEVEIHSENVSRLTYTVSWVLETMMNQVNPCFSIM